LRTTASLGRLSRFSAVEESCTARAGVARLIRAHLEWVVNPAREFAAAAWNPNPA